MNCVEKVEWVLALLADRLKECRKGEAEIFVSKFESHVRQSRYHFYHVYDEKSYKQFINDFEYNRSGDFINHIQDQIENHKRLHNLNIDLSEDKIEILVINDGI